GGEHKRIVIACELTAHIKPNMLCIDEPTSGLDSSAALVVINCLKVLSRRHGMTIIASIHQPNNDLFHMFDNIYVLAKGGHCLYDGVPLQLRQHLIDCDYILTENDVPIEVLLKMASKDNTNNTLILKSHFPANMIEPDSCMELEFGADCNQTEAEIEEASLIKKNIKYNISMLIVSQISALLFMKEPKVAMMFAILVQAVLVLLGNSLFPVKELHYVLQVLSSLSYIRYAFECIVLLIYGFGRCSHNQMSTVLYSLDIEENVFWHNLLNFSPTMSETGLSLVQMMVSGGSAACIADMATFPLDVSVNSLIHRDNRIESCSGGQIKRICIALELTSISKPYLLFIDEPTTGLDTYAAHVQLSCLKQLSRKHNISVIVSIHQPNNDLFHMFDNIYVLAKGGHCLYDGVPHQLKQHLIDCDISVGENEVPIEVLIKLSFNGREDRDVKRLCDKNMELTLNTENMIAMKTGIKSKEKPLISMSGLSDESRIYVRNGRFRTCFIQQNICDHLMEGLTVRQTLVYASRLKNSRISAHLDHQMIASELMSSLVISDTADNRVETCSGGEHKRIVIACELTAHIKPNMLCIDEPTSGLDSSAALVVSA
ncbi:unnamed protein product, partial [Oppiella nova]